MCRVFLWVEGSRMPEKKEDVPLEFAGLNKKFPLHPTYPERVCWGCDRYCAHDALACGNGADRTPHPVELFGEDWLHFAGASTS